MKDKKAVLLQEAMPSNDVAVPFKFRTDNCRGKKKLSRFLACKYGKPNLKYLFDGNLHCGRKPKTD